MSESEPDVSSDEVDPEDESEAFFQYVDAIEPPPEPAP